ncbi:signaling receptor binding [Pristimantis euphronides]
MNNTLKHWREAATLILAAGCQHLSAAPKITTQGPWHNQKKTTFDYEVLLLQRSQKSGFMANAFVFPGGLVEPSDFSNDWVKVFDRHVQKPNFGLGVVKQPPDTRSPMFTTDRMKFGSLIPGEVAFRICAIRETFEESGILLVVPENSDIENNQNKFMATYEQDGEVVARWREKVQSDPLRFIEMCRELRCVPNIWALHEWGNWLTPVHAQNSRVRRYDTAFFICCLPRKPVTSDDQKEVTTFKWWTPPEAIEKFGTNTWIPPPQLYDLSRLCNFNHLEDLQRFALHRGLEGCERYMVIFVHAKDDLVQILPGHVSPVMRNGIRRDVHDMFICYLSGDELYPDDPDITGEAQKLFSIDRTIEEIIREGKRIHRVIIVNGLPTIFVNIQPKYKHINPFILTYGKDLEIKSQL